MGFLNDERGIALLPVIVAVLAISAVGLVVYMNYTAGGGKQMVEDKTVGEILAGDEDFNISVEPSIGDLNIAESDYNQTDQPRDLNAGTCYNVFVNSNNDILFAIGAGWCWVEDATFGVIQGLGMDVYHTLFTIVILLLLVMFIFWLTSMLTSKTVGMFVVILVLVVIFVMFRLI